MSETNLMKVSACEISLSDHCILKCAGCSHASPHLAKRFTAVEMIERDLFTLSKVLSADELRVAGGEPLLHPELLAILQIVNKSRIANKVTLITNGLLLHLAPEAMWNEIDHLRLSVYPGVKITIEVDQIHKHARTHGVSVSLNKIKSFNNVFLNRKISSFMTHSVFRNCLIAHRSKCNFIHGGRLYRCPEAGLMEERLKLLGTNLKNKEHDGIPLHSSYDLQGELKKYLENKRSPLQACSYCLGTIGKTFAPHQLDEEGLRAELKHSHDHLIPLISPKNLLYSYLKKHKGIYRIVRKIRDRLAPVAVTPDLLN